MVESSPLLPPLPTLLVRDTNNPPTAIHPYIVTRTKSRAMDDLCYVLYGNHHPLSTIPLLFSSRHGKSGLSLGAAEKSCLRFVSISFSFSISVIVDRRFLLSFWKWKFGLFIHMWGEKGRIQIVIFTIWTVKIEGSFELFIPLETLVLSFSPTVDRKSFENSRLNYHPTVLF